MEYIEKILGIQVSQKPWEHFSRMPFYIQDKFDIQKTALGSQEVLFLYPKGDLDRIEALQKQILRIRKAEQLPVVIVLATITRFRRDSLLEARLPFVVPGKQLYLPFMGTYLAERFDIETVKMEKLQPAAQVLFFYYLYQKEKQIYLSDAVRDLGYSAMTMSRAARQLVQTELFTEHKEGVHKILAGICDGKSLFEKMRPALINPVRRRTSICKANLTDAYVMAGDTAVAKQTMMNDSMFRCYAVAGKPEVEELPYAMNAETDVVIELWKYDPKLLSRSDTVDPLSLMMSFEDDDDERIQLVFDDLLDQLWGK